MAGDPPTRLSFGSNHALQTSPPLPTTHGLASSRCGGDCGLGWSSPPRRCELTFVRTPPLANWRTCYAHHVSVLTARVLLRRFPSETRNVPVTSMMGGGEKLVDCRFGVRATVLALLLAGALAYKCPNEQHEISMCVRMSGTWKPLECHCTKPRLELTEWEGSLFVGRRSFGNLSTPSSSAIAHFELGVGLLHSFW